MNRKCPLWIVGILLPLAAVNCSRKVAPPAKPMPAVMAREISPRTVRSELTLTGSIEPDRAARLAAQVDGEVVALLAREGSVVEEGQILVKLDPARITAALDEARADLLAARAELEDGRRVLDRDRALFDRRGLSQEVLEKSETDLLRFEAAEARSKARIAGLEAQLADTEVRAPFAGYILERSVEQGDVVKNGTPLLVVASRDYHALVPLSEIIVVGLREGSRVLLQTGSGTSSECPGRIRRIRPRIDPVTRTAEVEIVPDRQPCAVRWLPGMLVRATMTLAEKTGVLAVPAETVSLRPDGSRSVFIFDDGIARQRRIVTGLEGDGWIEVVSGLSPGDKVIVQGFEKLKDGVSVSASPKSDVPAKPAAAVSEPKGKI